ncbi:MAG: hypothetical protein HFE90_05950 [Firmicutes bacterium]|nr:hypothetical protein [Bacillota bacterium]
MSGAVKKIIYIAVFTAVIIAAALIGHRFNLFSRLMLFLRNNAGNSRRRVRIRPGRVRRRRRT